MSDWLFHLPIVWMTLVFLSVAYLITWAIDALVMTLATGDRLRTIKAISPGLLPPLGIMYGLLVAFLATQVWGDLQRVHESVNREASALRAVVLLSEGKSMRGAVVPRSTRSIGAMACPATLIT